MTAITGVDGNSVYIPVLIVQNFAYTLISDLRLETPGIGQMGWVLPVHTGSAGHFRSRMGTLWTEMTICVPAHDTADPARRAHLLRPCGHAHRRMP